MDNVRTQLRKMILKEMRKREFGESNKKDISNLRLIDIIKEEMMSSEDDRDIEYAEDFNDLGAVGQQTPMSADSFDPAPEFSVWNPSESTPEDMDWGFNTPSESSGIQVSPDLVERLTIAVSNILNTPVGDFGDTGFSPTLGLVLGRIASMIESIQSNSIDATPGALGVDDVSSLESIVMGPTSDTLRRETPELLEILEQILTGAK